MQRMIAFNNMNLCIQKSKSYKNSCVLFLGPLQTLQNIYGYEYKTKSACALWLNPLQFYLWFKNQTEKKKHLKCVTLMNLKGQHQITIFFPYNMLVNESLESKRKKKRIQLIISVQNSNTSLYQRL